jgi:hypothetical protein
MTLGVRFGSPGFLPWVKTPLIRCTPLAGATTWTDVAHLRRADHILRLLPWEESQGYSLKLLAEHSLPMALLAPTVRAELFCSKAWGLLLPANTSPSKKIKNNFIAIFNHNLLYYTKLPHNITL